MSDALLGATLLALGGSANDFMTGFVSVPGMPDGYIVSPCLCVYDEYIHIYIHTYITIYDLMCVYNYIYIYTYVCYVLMYVCMSVCMYVM